MFLLRQKGPFEQEQGLAHSGREYLCDSSLHLGMTSAIGIFQQLRIGPTTQWTLPTGFT